MILRVPDRKCELVRMFPHDECHLLGDSPAPVYRVIGDLATALDAHKSGHTLTIMRDWEFCIIAIAEHPLGPAIGDVFAITERGDIGHGGVNLPRYYSNVAELVADTKRVGGSFPPPSA